MVSNDAERENDDDREEALDGVDGTFARWARVKEVAPRIDGDVLDRVAEGMHAKEIALALDISPRTVEVYRANLMTKLQAGSVSDLVRMVIVADSA